MNKRGTKGLNSLFFIALTVVIFGFFYYLYSFKPLIILYLPFLLQATVATIIISLVSIVLATLLGFGGALGRLSSYVPIRWLATLYVEVIRGTPVLVQLLIWYYGFGNLLSSLGFNPYTIAFQLMTVLQNNSLVPDSFNGFFYGVIGLSFNYGAYLTEVFRSGIESVPRGQSEAALSLGFTPWHTLRRIVLPQAIRLTIPPFTNYFITLIQDSALLSTFAITELEQQTYALAFPQVDANKKLFVFVYGALFYLIICYPLSLLARYLERRMARGYL
ncbi:MAG: amino acid ABC transporter permease [Ktedonobacteraceae bacterium]|nr:amino acid ABC transporter permease [Ktedonobacteraceae bacterium]